MKIVTITATQLRKDVFSVIEAAKYNRQVTDIMLHGEVVASVIHKKKKLFDWEKYKKEQKRVDSVIRNANWNDIKDFRKTFDRKIKGW